MIAETGLALDLLPQVMAAGATRRLFDTLRSRSVKASRAVASSSSGGIGTKPGMARTRSSQAPMRGYADRSKPPSPAQWV